MKTSGRRESRRRLIQLAGTAISIAVPRTECRAAGPGNGVAAVSRKTGASIMASPARLTSSTKALSRIVECDGCPTLAALLFLRLLWIVDCDGCPTLAASLFLRLGWDGAPPGDARG